MNTTTAPRILGQGPSSVSPIGFGCMGLVGWYGTRNDAESTATLLEALESGVNHFDTAASNQIGENEKFIGPILKSWRERIVLASKCGLARAPDGGVVADNRPQTIRSSLDASLARLGTDYIDLFYLHRIDTQVPIEESVGTLAELVAAGKIRHIGLSECSIATLRRASAVHPIAAVQTEYSLWSRDPERGMLATCRELGTTFVAYSPLGRGFLTGKYKTADDVPADDNRRNHPRFQGENFEKNLQLVAEVEAMAKEKGVASGQLALAWVLAQGDDIVPIPGTKRRSYLEQNVDALTVELSAEDLARLNEIMAPGAASGTRYAAPQMQALNR